jgi:hypothetical protein
MWREYRLVLGSIVTSFGSAASWFAANAGAISQVAGAIGACLGIVLTLLMIGVWVKKNIDAWSGRKD